jgi:hypothetical protein
MKENQEQKQAVPVMRQLARPISKEELAIVSGAGTMPCNGGMYWPGSDTDNLP